ncbi:hypothetical protein Q7A53_05815 [Halobacillus rhizosphaerae]|uniref:hypothetical protein n=1 Tax=Halobacillus rhizosphaerae TaxID=3064889 RepID=UPI00398BA1C4
MDMKNYKEQELKRNKEALKYFRKWVNGEHVTPAQINKIEWLIADFQVKTNNDLF